MWSTDREIAAGDLVIVWLTRDTLQPLVVTPGKDYNSKFGNYRHSDFVGIPYGSKVGSRSGKGFVYLLRPTPELWTIALPHRTQILYLADIAFITSWLDIKPGSLVIEAGGLIPPYRAQALPLLPIEKQNIWVIPVPLGPRTAFKDPFPFSLHLSSFSPSSEILPISYRNHIDVSTFTSLPHLLIVPFSGTGSGSFSHSVVRSFGSAGHLWSFEFHETRANRAREEFARHGMADVVTLTQRNVCKDGFTVVDTVDSVFLDLPAPWEAVEHAKVALRKDRTTRICCFSPCMEQVLRTVTALNDAGFTEITMYETLLRPHEVNAVPTLPSVREAADRLRNSEQKREEKRQRQIAGSRHFKSSAPQGAGKRKREEGPKDEESSACRALDIKRVRPSEVAISADLELMALQDAASLPRESHEVPLAVDAPISHPVTRVLTPAKVSVSKASPDVRGHTSYLTFACLVPKPSVPTQTDANLNVHATIETDGTPDTCEI